MLKPNNSSGASLSKDLPPSGSRATGSSRSGGSGPPPARKDLNRYLGASEPTPPPPRRDNLSLNLNLRKNRKQLKSTPDQSPVDENVTFLDSPTSGDHASQDVTSLAVERPRKKLSFREPEIMGYYMQMKQGVASRLSRKTKSPKTSVVGKGSSTPVSSTVVKNTAVTADVDDSDVFSMNQFSDSAEDLDLESQAMRVVRTVGQAFEVCHKLSINSPSQDEMGRKGDPDPDHSSSHIRLIDATQDGTSSDKETELPPDKPSKKDLTLDQSAEPVFNDSSSTLDLHSQKSDSIRASSPLKRPLRLDFIPPTSMTQSSMNHSSKKSPMGGTDMYTSPMSDPLKPLGEGGGGGSMLSATLSTHHELQLMREQLDQQAQQTQTALSQVHLLREQLQVESSARIEAQTRIHQLLSQNKELLDHIQSLVAHLQEQERLHKVQVAQVAAVAAQQHQQQAAQHHQQQQQQQQQHQHNVNSTVPQTPMYLPDMDIEAIRAAYQQQMPSSPHHQQRAFPSINFSSYCPPQIPSFSTAPSSSHLFSTPGGPLMTSQASSEQFQNQLLQSLQNLNIRTSYPNLYPSNSSLYSSSIPAQQPSPNFPPRISQQSSYAGSPTNRTSVEVSSKPSDSSGKTSDEQAGDEAQFIKPLSQNEPVTTTESDGRVRVIVPVTEAETASVMRLDPPPARRRESPIRRNLNLPNGPPFITRSTSEKVPNRSELMSQVQRTQWARHTTK